MVKIKYVGAKHDGERAFKEHTGIEWFPGDVHEVKPEHAQQMLHHPDVFAVHEETTSLAHAKTPAAAAGKTDPLAGLDDAGVRAYAKAHGLKVKAIGVLKGANLRAKVTAAMPG